MRKLKHKRLFDFLSHSSIMLQNFFQISSHIPRQSRDATNRVHQHGDPLISFSEVCKLMRKIAFKYNIGSTTLLSRHCITAMTQHSTIMRCVAAKTFDLYITGSLTDICLNSDKNKFTRFFTQCMRVVQTQFFMCFALSNLLF